MMTVAGSDSGGGAGLQGDLKTFSSIGVYGSSVVTAITAQDSQSVRSTEGVSPNMVKSQMEAVIEDLKPQGVKLGMLYSHEIVRVVATTLKRYAIAPVILDPILISSSGHPLLQPDAIDIMKQELFPLTELITPNIPEAEALTHMDIKSEDDMKRACERLSIESNSAVLLKGGHKEGMASDILFDGSEFHHYHSERIPNRSCHGTGCALSSAITAYLALGHSLQDAVRLAKDYVTGAIRYSQAIGGGYHILNHFWMRDHTGRTGETVS